MNSAENPALEQAATEELRQEIRVLRRLLNTVAIAGLILSCSLSVYFLREVILIRRQSSEHRHFVAEYEKWREDVQRQFQSFARTNADFAPILRRYFPSNAPAARP